MPQNKSYSGKNYIKELASVFEDSWHGCTDTCAYIYYGFCCQTLCKGLEISAKRLVAQFGGPVLHYAVVTQYSFLGKYTFQHVLSVFGFESVGLVDFASTLLSIHLLNTALVFNRNCKTQFQN